AFPQSKFLVTERDPYEFVISLGHLGNRIDRRLARALDRPWRHPLLSALAWRGYINSIEKARIDYPDRILVIRTSDLRERSEVAVADAQRFLGVPVCELPVGLPPLNSSFAGGRRPEPSGDEVFWTNVVARDAMLRNGFLPRRTPIAPSQLFTSFLELPVSLAISCARLPWKTRGSRRDYLSLWLRRPSAAGTSKG